MASIPEIDVQTARTLLDDGAGVFVDVRDPRSYAAGHIPGATHLTERTVADFLESTDKNLRVVVYCYHGHSSLSATAWLMERGFSQAASMAGGFGAWQMTYPELTE